LGWALFKWSGAKRQGSSFAPGAQQSRSKLQYRDTHKQLIKCDLYIQFNNPTSIRQRMQHKMEP